MFGMEVTFKNLRMTSLTFPTRKLRNKSEENWVASEEQRLFLEKQSVALDGSDGDVSIKYKVPDYFNKLVRDGKVDTKGIFYPTETDPEIEALLDLSAQRKLGGKRWQDASAIELLEAGLLF